MEDTKDEAQKDPMGECAAQLSSAAQALERVIGKLEAQYEALNQKIDRIIATVEKQAEEKSSEAAVAASAQDEQVIRLAKENRELRQRTGRKTLPSAVNTLLAKSGVGEGVQVELGTLERALGALTIEQRIAVKAELARAGMIA
jgi:hypothetical protein